MGEMLNSALTWANGWIWSVGMLVLVCGSGLYFSIRYKFTQVRNFKDMVRNLVSNKASDDGISTFASFCTTMSARLGSGNIAGVATAVYMGGPGAVFWMWITAILVSATTFTECTLGQLYKHRIDNQYRGGAYYIAEKAYNAKWFSYLFAVVTIIGMAICLVAVQSNMISETMNVAVGTPYAVTGIIGTIVVGIIILGGIRRISTMATILVPFMAIAFFIVTIVILIAYADRIGMVFGWIFSCAFTSDAVFGGTIGMAISWGVRRAVFASGSGMGEETPAAAAAETSHPVGQGLANSFGIYMDILVCTCTALIILLTDCFNTVNGYIGSGSPEMQKLFEAEQYGIAFPQEALATLLPMTGKMIIGFILILFALTSVLSYAYQAETALAYIMNNKSQKVRKGFLLGINLLTLASYLYFSMTTSDVAWAAGDFAVGSMVWLNVPLILLLSPNVVKLLRDYEQQRKEGIQYPVFDPDKLGIKNADLWKDINKDLIEHPEKRV